MNNLQIFNYESREIRTIDKDGDIWFVLKDVCEVLNIQNSTDVAKRLDEDEVTRFNLGGLSGETNIINESGLYNVILRSDKEEAKPFRKWVTNEVLPAIRKTGGYMVTPQAFNLDYAKKCLEGWEKAEKALVSATLVDKPEPPFDIPDKDTWVLGRVTPKVSKVNFWIKGNWNDMYDLLGWRRYSFCQIKAKFGYMYIETRMVPVGSIVGNKHFELSLGSVIITNDSYDFKGSLESIINEDGSNTIKIDVNGVQNELKYSNKLIQMPQINMIAVQGGFSFEETYDDIIFEAQFGGMLKGERKRYCTYVNTANNLITYSDFLYRDGYFSLKTNRNKTGMNLSSYNNIDIRYGDDDSI